MMKRKGLRVLMTIALVVCMLVTTSAVSVTPAQAADEEFQIGAFFAPTWAYTNATQYDYLRDAHINLIQTFYPNDLGMSTTAQMNTVLDLAAARGMKVQVSDSRNTSLTDANVDAIANSYKDHPATAGYYVADEPGSGGFSYCANAYRRFLLNDPDCVPNVNLLPIAAYGTSYGPYLSEYVNGWIDTIGSDNLKYLTFDNYAYLVGGTIRGDYYQNLAYIRNAGLSRNIKTACYVQSVGLGSGMRRPNGNEARLDAYTALAYGMKGIYWFTWFQPVISGYAFTPAIIDASGNKTDLYTPIQTVNGEIKKLGPTLMSLTSREVYFKGAIPSGATPLPSGFFWQPTTNNNQIISYFTNASGRSYIMVVNRDYTNSRTLSFNLPTKPASVTEVSKSTGAEVATNYSSSTGNISASFLPGEGRLYAISAESAVAFVMMNDTNIDISYSGTNWGYGSGRGVGNYQDDLHYTIANNDSFQYTFSGTGIDFISERSPGYGDIDIYIDNVFQQTINCSGTINNQPLQVVYSKKGFSDGVHTIKGVKKSGTYMVVDAFKVYANTLTIDNKDVAISYSGTTWYYSANRGLGNYEDDLHHSSANNEYFQYTFNGTGIDYIAEKSPGYGNVDIYIDGVFQRTINCEGAINNQAQQVVYSKYGLSNGTHTIKGVKKSGAYMVVDALRVYTNSSYCNVVRTNDTYPGIVYSGSGWGHSTNRGTGNYRNDLHYTTVNNDYFEYKFTGTSVNFVSEKSPGYGDVDIYIDGVFQQTISCAGSINNQPQVVYSKTGLPYGVHTLKAVKKSGTYMVVDGF